MIMLVAFQNNSQQHLPFTNIYVLPHNHSLPFRAIIITPSHYNHTLSPQSLTTIVLFFSLTHLTITIAHALHHNLLSPLICFSLSLKLTCPWKITLVLNHNLSSHFFFLLSSPAHEKSLLFLITTPYHTCYFSIKLICPTKSLLLFNHSLLSHLFFFLKLTCIYNQSQFFLFLFFPFILFYILFIFF